MSSAPAEVRELGVNEADLTEAGPDDHSAAVVLVSLVSDGLAPWHAVTVVRQCRGDEPGVTQSASDVDGGVM